MSPPYDQFKKALVDQLFELNPHNIARIVLAPPDGEPDRSGAWYREKAALLNRWVAEGALVQDPVPGIYPYAQSYTVGGQRLTREGFIALGDLRGANILPHEETHAHVREDRSLLRQATAADFGLIFVVYSDPSGDIDRLLRDCASGAPLLTVSQPDGSEHVLHRCADAERITSLLRLMEEYDCVIADGHHRTAAAFDAWKAKGDDAWASVMMAFFNANAPGMTVLPIHRTVDCPPQWDFVRFLDRLADYFEVIRYPIGAGSAEDLARQLEDQIQERTHAGQAAFGLVGPPMDAAWILEAPGQIPANWPHPEDQNPAVRDLPTAIFETAILRGALHFESFQVDRGDRLTFPKDASQVIAEVRAGKHPLGFILPPTPLDAIFEAARIGQNLPQKSTYFFPKLLTGLTVHRIADSA